MKTFSGTRAWGLGIRSAVVLLVCSSAALAQPADPTRRAPRSQPASATQPAPPATSGEIALPPIECWWKTDRSAVRVGEHFLMTLTCAVLDTERVRVVVDESALAPTALHLVPFDIIDGQRFRDIQNAPRRFFQYQYTMRVLGEEFFGREITLPRLQISYRVQNSLQGGAALAGRESQYSLVPVPIRILSMVPPGAADIRDTPAETFGDVDRRLFRSNVLLIVGAGAFVLAVLMMALLIARAAVKRRASAAAAPRAVSALAAARAAARELAAVRAESQREGWTGELAGRAASALRLAGAVALGRPIAQKEVGRAVQAREGEIAAPSGLRTLRGKKLLLSAAVTPGTSSPNGNSATSIWQPLSQSLSAFSAAHYSRPSTGSGPSESVDERNGIDGTALDTAMAEGQDAVRRLQLWQLTRFGRRRSHTPSESVRPTWAR